MGPMHDGIGMAHPHFADRENILQKLWVAANALAWQSCSNEN
jgi:hypothetical protein